MWGRNCYRFSDLDFEANLKDGHGIDWPIRYKDLKPWYDYVETFIGLSGENCGLEHLPDQILMPPFEMNCVEKHIRKRVEQDFKDRRYINARAAVLTQPHNGRGKCMSRNLCRRGCPYGAYFSSNSSTIPAALKTGNLTIRPYTIVESILYDSTKKLANGVRVIDTETKESTEFFAKIVSINASTISSTAILLNSKSSEFPDGLGNSNGTLGHYLTDHTDSVGAWGMWEEDSDTYYLGQRPNQMYIPRFRNVGNDKQDFLRGYAYECFSWKRGWDKYDLEGIGVEYKAKLVQPGPWEVLFVAICESIPDPKNKMTLSKTEKDSYGIPLVELDVSFDKNMTLMRDDAANSAKAMMEKFEFKYATSFNEEAIPGKTIHESGTMRMSKNPSLGVLNEWNQLHDCKNVIVTDGSCLNSSPCQNPSLTYMALTVRAIDQICKNSKR
jgi:choline dehydrogenase-like flavoprotein